MKYNKYLRNFAKNFHIVILGLVPGISLKEANAFVDGSKMIERRVISYSNLEEQDGLLVIYQINLSREGLNMIQPV